MALTKAHNRMIAGSYVNVIDYGADPTGATDSRAAIQAAIDATQATGGTVFFPEGSFLINSTTSPDGKDDGLVIPTTSPNDQTQRIVLCGSSRSTILKAGNNDMYVIRLSDSNCRIENMSINANSKTDIVGIGVVPEDRTQTTTRVDQNYNVLTGLYISGCKYGLVYSTGPDVGGGDSGCWYNVLSDSHVYSCTTGILLDASQNSLSSASGVNRNKFMNVRFGQNMNTGVQIDDGDTNTFLNCDFEGINDGTSPNAIPTAVKIAFQGSSSGADCNHNTFISCKMEENTRDLDNANPRSEFYGCVVQGAKLNLTANPVMMIGGNDASQVPQIMPGYIYQGNSQIAGYPNNVTNLTGGMRSDNVIISDYQGFRSIEIGTIAPSGSEAVTIIPAKNDKRYAAEVFVVGRELTNSGTIQMRAYVIANWLGASTQALGIGDTDFNESLGVNDYRNYSGATLAISWSSNNATLTVTNNGTSNMVDVNVLVRHLWS